MFNLRDFNLEPIDSGEFGYGGDWWKSDKEFRRDGFDVIIMSCTDNVFNFEEWKQNYAYWHGANNEYPTRLLTPQELEAVMINRPQPPQECVLFYPELQWHQSRLHPMMIFFPWVGNPPPWVNPRSIPK